MTDIKEAHGLEVVGYSYGNGMLINNTTSPDDPIYTKLVRLSDAQAVIDQLRADLETANSMLIATSKAGIQLRERVLELEYAAELDRTADLYAQHSMPAGYVMVPVELLHDLTDMAHDEAYRQGVGANAARPEKQAKLDKTVADSYALIAAAPKAESFCYCDDEVSLQMVSGGGAPEGLFGRLTLKINGEYVSYLREAPKAEQSVDQALMDAITTGTGFTQVGADGSVKRIAPEEWREQPHVQEPARNPDVLALNAAREIMALVYGPTPTGGSPQLLAQIQCVVSEAIVYAAPQPVSDNARDARDALVEALKDLRWRIDDTADQLQATDYAGNRRYGLDEWSAPILNLKRAIDVIDAAMGSKGDGN